MPANIGEQLRGRVIMIHPQKKWRAEMSKKLMTSAILAAIAVGAIAPSIAMAKSVPKTKADCEKVSTMKWDDATSKCVKK